MWTRGVWGMDALPVENCGKQVSPFIHQEMLLTVPIKVPSSLL